MRQKIIGVFVFTLILIFTTVCFAQTYPVSQNTLEELRAITSNVSFDLYLSTGQVLLGSIKLTDVQLTLIIEADANIYRIGTALVGIYRMLEMEFLHAEEKQFNSKATGKISEYVNLVISDINIVIERDNEILKTINDKMLQEKYEKNKMNMEKALGILNKVMEELP